MVANSIAIWKSIYRLPTPIIKEKGEKELQEPKKVEKETTWKAQEVSVEDVSVRETEEEI